MTGSGTVVPQDRSELWRLEQLALVSQVATQVTSIYDLDELLVRVVGLIYQTFEFYAVSLFTLEEKTLVPRAQAGPAETFMVGDAFIPTDKTEVPLGKGIIGWVAAHQQELVVTDVRHEQRFRYSPEFPDTKAEIALPLKVEERLLGVLDVQLDYPEDFDESDLLVLRALAGQVSMAIEDTRLYAQARRHRDHLASVSAVSWAVASILDVDELLQKVCELIRKYFDYPCVQVFTVHYGRRQVVYRTGSGQRAERLKHRRLVYALDDPQGVIPCVARTGQTILINDVRTSAVYRPPAISPADTKSELSIPLTYADDVLGVLDVQSNVLGAFSQDDLATMETLAANIAVALRNANLYRSERWRRQVADSLRRISGALITDVNLANILDSILTELKRNLPADILAIWLMSQPQTRSSQRLHLSTMQAAEACQLAPDFLPEQDPWLIFGLEATEPVVRTQDHPLDPIAACLDYEPDHSAVVAPLRVQDQILGLLTLVHHQTGRYGREAKSITTAFANQAAIAIENARLFQLAQEEAQINDALLKVAEATQGFVDLDQVLAEVAQIPPLIAEIDRCALWLRQRDSDVFQPKASFGFSPANLEFFNHFSIIADRVAAIERLGQTRTPLLIIDAPEDERLPVEMIEGLDLQSLLLLPIVAHDEMLGFMLTTFDSSAALHEDSVRLITGIAHQAAVAIESKYLFDQKAEQERLAYELKLAHDIQASFIPSQLPTPTGWEIVAYWQSAQEVSGDYYDIIEIGPQQLGIVMADVAGKGMPAALYMVLTRSLIRGSAPGQTDPGVVLKHTNQLLLPDTRRGMFVSLFYTILDSETGTLIYANAGHNLPLLVRANGQTETLRARGLVLGVLPDIEPEVKQAQLHPGDGVVFYTDGVTEVFNASADIFGETRLKTLLQENWQQGPATLLDQIRQTVSEFSASTVPHDDFTLLILKRRQ